MKYIAAVFLAFVSTSTMAQDHKMETLVMPTVTFVAEQTGEFESRVKGKLTEALSAHKEVKRAYLVSTQYSDGTSGVALALVSDKEPSDALLKDIQAKFQEMASSSTFLDTLVLNNSQETQIKAVATPFYVVGP